MGTFLGDYGGTGIPESKLEECTQHVLRILDAGGMMDIDEVSLYGRRLVLLRRPEVDMDSNSVCFCYNYFFNEYKAVIKTNTIIKSFVDFALKMPVLISMQLLFQSPIYKCFIYK